METTLATYPEQVWTAADVYGVWLSFSSGETSNSLECTILPNNQGCVLDLALQEGSYRRTAHREPSMRFGNDLVRFVSDVTQGWEVCSRGAEGVEGLFSWSISLTAADGSSLRECSGNGLIPDAERFFTLARGLDRISRGFVLGVGPLAEIDKALRNPSIESYDQKIDRASGGLLSLAIAKDYFAEAARTSSLYHRAQSMELARTYYIKASEAGSTQAMAHLGLMDLGMGGTRNIQRARERFERASRLGSSEACSLLADLIVEAEVAPCDEARALALYEQGYRLATLHFDPGALGFCAERLAQALASGLGGMPDLPRARDLCVEAEVALSAASVAGEAWLQPSQQRVQALSERLARMLVEASEI